MGAKVKIKVCSCRNLPVMDRSSGLTDAYVIVKFGEDFQFRTNICKKTLNPTWNFINRFEVPNNDYLHENVIEFKVIDYDIVTQDDNIGSVIVDTNILVLNQVNRFSGWIPIFDSIRGICGELKISIKIDFLQNLNPFTSSASEVQFFSNPSPKCLFYYNNNNNSCLQNNNLQNYGLQNNMLSTPSTSGTVLPNSPFNNNTLQNVTNLEMNFNNNSLQNSLQIINPLPNNTLQNSLQNEQKLIIGDLTEELLIDDDPEYDWKDLIRSSRSSNDERQLLLYKLSGRLKRKIGNKELLNNDNNLNIINNGYCKNIVIGYEESFDLEEDNIIVRGLGTKCKLMSQYVTNNNSSSTATTTASVSGGGSVIGGIELVQTPREVSNNLLSPRDGSNVFNVNVGNVMNNNVGNMSSSPTHPPLLSNNSANSVFSVATTTTGHSPTNPNLFLDSLKDNCCGDHVKLLTIKTIDTNQIIYLGGIVQARSCKLIETENMKLSEMQKERDSWWNELRTEIRENAKTLGCTHVIGYSEQIEIFTKGNVCILQAQGTAAILNLFSSFESQNSCSNRFSTTLINNPITTTNATSGNVSGGGSSVMDGSGMNNNSNLQLSTTVPIENIVDGTIIQQSLQQIEEKYCTMFHLPRNSPFYHSGASKCCLNNDGFVPNVFLSTCEIPNLILENQHFTKHFIDARICRSQKRIKKQMSESNANAISNILPFAVHDLHKQFIHKMKLCHVNACFNISYNITLNDNFIILTCKGTGIYLDCLPRNLNVDFIVNNDIESSSLRLLKEYSDYYSTDLDIRLQEREELEEDELDSLMESPRNNNNNPTTTTGAQSFLIRPTNNNNNLLDNNDNNSNGSYDDFNDNNMNNNNINNNNTLNNTTTTMDNNLKSGFALEMEDEHDEDFVNSLIEPLLPNGIEFSTTKFEDYKDVNMSPLQYIFIEKSFPLNRTTHNENQQQQYIASLFREMYITLSFKLLLYINENLNHKVYVMGLSDKIRFNNANEFTITLEAMPMLITTNNNNQLINVMNSRTSNMLNSYKANLPVLFPGDSTIYPMINMNTTLNGNNKKGIRLSSSSANTMIASHSALHNNLNSTNEDLLFTMEDDHLLENNNFTYNNNNISNINNNTNINNNNNISFKESNVSEEDEEDKKWIEEEYVHMTPLYFIPGTNIVKVIGKVSQHLVRESNSVLDFGSFQQETIMEATSIIKAHTKAIGCNALLNYSVKFHAVVDNTARKQAYIMLTVGGDAAKVEYIKKPNGLSKLIELSSIMEGIN
ncbi:hypothetical protein ABK040_016508 [Willaertia magna]